MHKTTAAFLKLHKHNLNFDLQMTNRLLMQFMNYVVVMVTLIKNRPRFFAAMNTVFC